MKKEIDVPIWIKWNLTVPEAAALSGIGENRISAWLSETDCEFLLMKGTHRMVKRELFQEYVSKQMAI